MQTPRRTAKLVKARCSDVNGKGKPGKLHRSSSVEGLSFKIGVHTAERHKTGAILMVPLLGESRESFRYKKLIAIINLKFS